MEGTNETSETPFFVPVHSYCSIMGEAVNSAVIACRFEKMANEADAAEDDFLARDHYTVAGTFARYGLFSAFMAMEAAANSLLKNSKGISGNLYEDLEKLKTLNKFEIFSLVQGKPLKRGDHIYGEMDKVIGVRNKFFHPKPAFVDRQKILAKEHVNLDFLEIEGAVSRIGTILKFISWVVFDSCGYSIRDGSSLLSNIKMLNMELVEAREKLGFDIRSFGVTDEDTRGMTIEE